jgi:type IV secretion/conjugal transfer VirB4 family ATPase
MLSTKAFQTDSQGLATLLNYAAMVQSGVMLGKDGSLTAAFECEGLDIASATPAQRNYQADTLNTILTQHFGGGWVSHHELIRKPAAAYPEPEASAFPDPISRGIEAENRANFLKEGNHFESTNIWVVRYKSPSFQNPRLKNLFYESRKAEPVTSLESDLAYFERQLENLEDALSSILKVRRMRGYSVTDSYGQVHLRDDLVNYLNFIITGEYHPVNLPACGMYLDGYLGAQDLIPGDTPKIGDYFIGCISLTGMPNESYPNILEALNHLPLAYRWVTRMIYVDAHEAIGLLKKEHREWIQKAQSPFHQIFKMKGGLVNQDALNMTLDTQAVMTEVHSGQMAFGYCSQVVVLMNPDREALLENARLVIREIKRLGFNCRLETLNAMEAWLSTLPGHTLPNIRRPLVHSNHLAHMIPITSIWSGRAYCPNPLALPNLPPLMHTATTGSTPFRLNLHVSDVSHTLIMGPTGAGKSVLLATLAAQFRRYTNATITAFDKGRSMWALVEACGGQHYDIGGDDASLSFAPLSLIDTDVDMAWAEDWITTVYETRTGKTTTPRQNQEIHRAMTILRETKQPNERSLSDFLLTLQQCGAEDDLKAALSFYTLSAPYGNLLDARAEGLKTSSFTVFEIEELMAMKERIAIPVLLHLFRRFERSLQGQPALLLLDEAWVMLGHPVFRSKIRQWLKELRKKNCAVVLATQSLSDAVQSQIYDVLLESCPTKILLPNEEADKEGTSEHPGPRDLYAMMGLNAAEIQIIKTATKKRQYYYMSPEGRRLFDLGLGPLALSFVAVSDKEKLAHLNQLKAEHGSKWPFVWMKERGVDYESLVG